MGLHEASADVCFGGAPYARTTVTDDEILTIPEEMVGKFCFFRAVTSAVAIRFSTTAVALDVVIAARSTNTDTVLTAEGSEPHIYLEPGEMVQCRLRADWTHMAHVSADALGVFRFGPAQGAFNAET